MMNRLTLLLAFIIAWPLMGYAQRKRALMVGISSYHTYGYKVWPDIHGAEDVALLKPELKKKGFTVQTLSNEQATSQSILQALDRFIAATKKGDVAYLHFSCHGQPVEDGLKTGYPDNDEADKWDESIVPIDAGKTYGADGYKGEKHITDDELNSHVMRLRRKLGVHGVLFVVIDACHAGNMERDDFETVRGTNEGLTSNPLNKYNPADMSERSKPVQSNELSPVLYVEACESNQRNQEIKYERKDYGALSFNIWQMLSKATSFPLTIQTFMNSLSANIAFNKQQHNWLWPDTQTVVFEY